MQVHEKEYDSIIKSYIALYTILLLTRGDFFGSLTNHTQIRI